MTKQLTALYETKKMLEEEYRGGEDKHTWTYRVCPLCQVFRLPVVYHGKCKKCPFEIFSKEGHEGCSVFKCEYYEVFIVGSPIDETLSIIVAMIDAYERLK